MQEEHIDISLDKRLLKAIDELIEQGVYRDRDEAIRIAIAEKLYYLKQARNRSNKPDNETDGWPDYLEDKLGGSAV